MAGLLDFLQSASNTAADTVAAPVDLLAWALRKAGVPVPQNAIGGSEWLKQQGLKRDVPQSAASLAGETVGLLSPMVAAAKAPQIAKGLLQVEANAMAPTTLRPEAGVYLVHTPLKPNPLVGTRYQTTDMGGIAPRKPINWDEWDGASIMTYPTDMLSRNRRVDNISDIQIANPATTVGGLMYAADLSNIANKIGYASNAAAATSQNNRALRAIEENLKRGGTGRVLMAPHTMPRGGENFSTTPTEVALSIIDTVKPSTAVLDALSDRVRSATVKGVKEKYKDFVGFNDSKLRDQLFKGEGLSSGSAGDLRKVVIDKLSSAEAQKSFGFNYPDLQNAILDPNVMNKSPFLMGDTIFEALPQLGTSKGLHPAYSDNMPGVFVGNSSGAPIDQFMGDLYARKRLAQVGKPGPRQGEFADPDQLTRGQLSTAGEDIALFLDKAQIKRLKGLLGP